MALRNRKSCMPETTTTHAQQWFQYWQQQMNKTCFDQIWKPITVSLTRTTVMISLERTTVTASLARTTVTVSLARTTVKCTLCYQRVHHVCLAVSFFILTESIHNSHISSNPAFTELFTFNELNAAGWFIHRSWLTASTCEC